MVQRVVQRSFLFCSSRSFSSLVCTSLVCSLALLVTTNLCAAPPPVRYELGIGTELASGCVSPCACPNETNAPVVGVFDLEPLEAEEPFQQYAVQNFEAVVSLADGDHILRGSGFYRVVASQGDGRHQLTLNVVLNGEALTLKSDLVSMDTGFPSIEIAIGSNDGCRFVDLRLVAYPADTPTLSRGDCNSDGNLNVADAVSVLDQVFGAGAARCPDACDANDDGAIDIADAITLFSAIFLADAVLPAPQLCGVDPTPDSLGCDDLTSPCP